MKLLLLPLITFLSLPVFVFAQQRVYSPLVDLSNAGTGNNVQTFEGYINFLYGMSIAVAALLAVIKIIIAGTKYMLDDVISGKEDAKKDIQGAVLGLLLIISAVIILELINPQLINNKITFDKFQSERPKLEPALTTAGGLSAADQAKALAQGTDSCLDISDVTVTASGGSTRQAANAAACGDKGLEQLAKFEENCKDAGGVPTSGGTGSKIVICTTLNQSGIAKDQLNAARSELNYIKNTFGFSADIDGDGTRTKYNLTDEYIRLDGTTIIVDSRRFCESTFTATTMAKLEPLNRREVLDGCLTNNWGASRCSNINDGNNRDAKVTASGFSCSMPKQIIAADTFKITDPLGTRPPKDFAEMEKFCGQNNDLIKTRGLNFQATDFSVDPGDYDCFRY